MALAPSVPNSRLALVGESIPDWGAHPAEGIFGRVISARRLPQVAEVIKRLTGSARSTLYAVCRKVFVAHEVYGQRSSPSHCHKGGDNMATIRPDSGIQLLIIIGAMFVFTSVRPELGMMLLTLGVGAWALYNVANLSRQF